MLYNIVESLTAKIGTRFQTEVGASLEVQAPNSSGIWNESQYEINPKIINYGMISKSIYMRWSPSKYVKIYNMKLSEPQMIAATKRTGGRTITLNSPLPGAIIVVTTDGTDPVI